MFYILGRKPITTIRVIARKSSKGTEQDYLGRWTTPTCYKDLEIET